LAFRETDVGGRRKMCFAAAVVVLLGATHCSSDSRPAAVKALTDDEWYALCGTWVRVEEKSINTELKEFSWGKGKHVPDFSLDMDLGADPPYLAIPAAMMLIVHAERVDGDGIQLKTVIKQTNRPDRTVNLVVRLNDDGTMWFSDGGGFVGDGARFTYYKLDGPKKPK
jgi:hypothetical protein